MMTRAFTSGRVRKAQYDPANQELSLTFEDQKVLTYRSVQEEVFRRLCSAPNPATFWEDRIADEYPHGPPTRDRQGVPKQDLRDLFGGNDTESSS